LNIANRYELTEDVIRQTIALHKRVKIKLSDAVIAATSLVYDFALVSRNIKDFEHIENLELINPYK